MAPALMAFTKSQKPWPSYFLVRPQGPIVPLIAADELPPSIELAGVPRTLELEDTVGMLNLGLQRGGGSCYILEEKEKEPKSGKIATLAKATLTSSVPTTPTTSTPIAPKSRVVALPPMNPACQICRHWCHNGICKWGQQCKYKHIMPMTLNGLAEVGLNDWPAWYRKLNPGFFIGETAHGNEDTGGVQASGGQTGKAAMRERRRKILAGVGGPRVGGHCAKENVGCGGRCCVSAAKERKGKGGELDNEIVEKLRGIGVGIKEKGEKNGANVVKSIEKAAARDAKKWEDDTESEDDTQCGDADGEEGAEGDTSEDERIVGKGKGKLVDV